MGHLLGYARVSTTDQNPELQVDELTAAGCWKVWTDRASGALDRRPELDEVLAQLRPGDTLIVWRLDRLGRSLRHLIDVVTDLDARGVGFRSLRESIDTTTAGGRLVFHLFGALAQFEREIIRDRTVAGLTAARARGRVGGRPSKLTADKRQRAREMYDARQLTVEEIGKALGVSRTSIYRALGTAAASDRPAATPATEAPERTPRVDSPEELARTTPEEATPPAGRPRGRSRWFVVQADRTNANAPVAVVSGHTSEKAAIAAMRRNVSRSRARPRSDVYGDLLWQVRPADQITSRLVWDLDAKRGVVRAGPPP